MKEVKIVVEFFGQLDGSLDSVCSRRTGELYFVLQLARAENQFLKCFQEVDLRLRHRIE